MSSPQVRSEIGKIVLPKRKLSKPLPLEVRALLDPSEEAALWSNSIEEDNDDDDNDANQLAFEQAQLEETELISYDYGIIHDHDYVRQSDRFDHNYA